MKMQIDWNQVITGIVAFVFGLAVKTMLDMRIGMWIVRVFWWLPVRWIFRDNPPNLAGKWGNTWGAGGSMQYEKSTDRHSHPVIKQFGRYIYAEFISQGLTYGFFGRIIESYVVGEWFDVQDSHGYFGAYQLRIVSGKHMEGMWIGHSKTELTIRSGDEVWKKLE